MGGREGRWGDVGERVLEVLLQGTDGEIQPAWQDIAELATFI
jgi:hypothetical protein